MRLCAAAHLHCTPALAREGAESRARALPSAAARWRRRAPARAWRRKWSFAPASLTAAASLAHGSARPLWSAAARTCRTHGGVNGTGTVLRGAVPLVARVQREKCVILAICTGT